MAEARGGTIFLGYKAHYSLDWNSEMPVAYTVRPANENKKRHFKALALKAKKHFPNAKWHVADSQYSSGELRRFVRVELRGEPVIAKRGYEKMSGEDFYVDKLFRCRGTRLSA